MNETRRDAGKIIEMPSPLLHPNAADALLLAAAPLTRAPGPRTEAPADVVVLPFPPTETTPVAEARA